MKKILLVAATASVLAACTSDMAKIGDQTQLPPPSLEITQQNAGALINVQSTAESQSDNSSPVARVSTTTGCSFGGEKVVTGVESQNGATGSVEFVNCNEDGQWTLLGKFNSVVTAKGNEQAGELALVMTGDVTATHTVDPVDTKLSNFVLNMNATHTGLANISSTTTMTATIAYNSADASGSVNMYTKPMIAVDVVDGQTDIAGTYYIEGANGTYISINAATGEVLVNGQVWQQ